MTHVLFKTARPIAGAHFTKAFRFVGRVLLLLAKPVMSWNQRKRDRRLLQILNDRELRDLGIDRATIEGESALPFWRLRCEALEDRDHFRPN